jgi:perosamine synthetase
METATAPNCLGGLRIAVTKPPAEWFGGVDLRFALDMADELRRLGANLLEIDVAPLLSRDPAPLAQALAALEAFQPDLALALPNAGYAAVCRDLAGNNLFWDLAAIPTALIWDHGILQFASLLLEPSENAAESSEGCLARLKRGLDHPLILHYSPDRTHTAVMGELGILDPRQVRGFIQGAFPVYVRHGRAHAAGSSTLQPRLAFAGNLHAGRLASLPYGAHPTLARIEARLREIKLHNIAANLWDPLCAELAQLDEATRAALSLTPDSSFFWKFAADEIGIRGNTEGRLRVLTSLKPEVEFYGNFTEPEIAGQLQEQYGVSPRANLDCVTELPALYRNCEILVDVINTGYLSAISPKITSCFASGGFALCDYKEDFHAALGDLADAVMYHSLDQLQEKIDYYLTNPDRRREIARALQDEVFTRFTFSALCRRILVDEPAWRVAAALARSERTTPAAARSRIVQPRVIAAADMERIQSLLPGMEPALLPLPGADLHGQRPTLPVSEPILDGNESRYLNQCVQSGWISSAGNLVRDFEREFARQAESEFGVACSSGTTALHLATATLGLGPGDEVILPTFTMVATASAVAYTGATPVLADSECETWNIDPARIEAAITPRTRAIIAVHTYGHPAPMDPILEIARRHNLTVIEDAAEAHGAEYHGRRAGSLGRLACFSFYANKIVTTGEGGMLTTNDPEIARVARRLRDHAFSDERHFWHKYRGFSYRMTSLQAAVGLAQTERLDEFVSARRENARIYRELLESIPGLQLPRELPGVKSVFWMFGLLVHPEFGATRDQLRQHLAARGIETRTFFIPVHLQPVYYRDYAGTRFPAAELLCQRGMYLPSSSRLSRAEIARVAGAVAGASPKGTAASV